MPIGDLSAMPSAHSHAARRGTRAKRAREQHQRAQPQCPALAKRAGAVVVPAWCLRAWHRTTRDVNGGAGGWAGYGEYGAHEGGQGACAHRQGERVKEHREDVHERLIDAWIEQIKT